MNSEWKVDMSDANPPLTFDEVRQLDEFAGRSACDFRVNYDNGTWHVYSGVGVWVDTDIPAAPS